MKMYRRVFASYLCVCLVPLLLSLFTMVKLERSVQKTILAEQESILTTVQQNLDQKLVDASNTVAVLSEDTMLSDLNKQYMFSSQDRLDQRDLIDSLHNICSQQVMISSCFCYFSRSGNLLTDRRPYESDIANLFEKSLNLSDDVMLEIIRNANEINNVRIVYSLDGSVYCLILRNQYTEDYKEKLSSVGVLIEITDRLIAWNSETSEIFITDSSGQLVYGSQWAAEACSGIVEGSSGEINVDNDTYLYLKIPSYVSELNYGFLSQKAIYYEGVYALIRQMTMELAIYFIFGIALSFLLSRKTWSPFQNILDFMRKRINHDMDVENAESFSRILNDLADDRERLENRLLKEKEQKQSNYIGQYLLGLSHDPSSLSQYIEDGRPYHIILFSIVSPESSEFFQNVPQSKYMESKEMLFFAVQNILEEILLEERDGVSLVIENCVVMIVQDSDTTAFTVEEVNRAVSLTETALSLHFSCYVSPVYHQISEAPKGWKEVQNIYRSDIFWQKEGKISVRVIDPVPQKKDTGYLEQLEEFSEYLSSRSYEDASHSLKGLMEQNLLDKNLPFELVHSRFNLIAELMAVQLPEKERNYLLRQMLHQSSIEGMCRELREIFQQLQQEEASGQPGDKNALWAQSVRSYIHKNYADSALNASMIADYLQINLSTMSRRYKNATGHGVLDEIQMVRLEAAKKLLKEGLTVRETAEKVGYTEPRSMIRSFKRYEGVTPGEYAKQE